jgi:hypothetical protein
MIRYKPRPSHPDLHLTSSASDYHTQATSISSHTSEEHITDRQYSHDGVKKAPISWQADDIINLRQGYIDAILKSNPDVRSVRSEDLSGVQAKGKGHLNVTIKLRDLHWHDLVDEFSGGERTDWGDITARHRHVTYTLDVVIVQTVTRAGSGGINDFEFLKLKDVAIRASVEDGTVTGRPDLDSGPPVIKRPDPKD